MVGLLFIVSIIVQFYCLLLYLILSQKAFMLCIFFQLWIQMEWVRPGGPAEPVLRGLHLHLWLCCPSLHYLNLLLQNHQDYQDSGQYSFRQFLVKCPNSITFIPKTQMVIDPPLARGGGRLCLKPVIFKRLPRSYMMCNWVKILICWRHLPRQ